MEELFRIAQEDAEMSVMVNLLLDMSARIQDAVGPSYRDFYSAEYPKSITLEAKKSTARKVSISKRTADALRKLQRQRKDPATAVVFPPGESRDPSNKWVQRVIKFFKRKGKDVKTHDFRTTAATQYYR